MNIAENLKALRAELPEDVCLVAVSKTNPPDIIMEAYRAGQRVFGENKVQELVGKFEALPKDIEWHMIGHLQRNKVKYIVDFVSLIHGVDSVRLLREIDKRARNSERVVDCLLQVHIAEESSKFGFDRSELKSLLEEEIRASFPNVRIRGLMGMATFTDDTAKVRREFQSLKALFEQLSAQLPDADTLSMGMSGDYLIALDEGSNMVRIGSRIFGPRNT